MKNKVEVSTFAPPDAKPVLAVSSLSFHDTHGNEVKHGSIITIEKNYNYHHLNGQNIGNMYVQCPDMMSLPPPKAITDEKIVQKQAKYTFTDTQVFVNGALYGDIVYRNGNAFTIRLVTGNLPGVLTASFYLCNCC